MEETLVLHRRYRNQECRNFMLRERRARRLQRQHEREQRQAIKAAEEKVDVTISTEAAAKAIVGNSYEQYLEVWKNLGQSASIYTTTAYVGSTTMGTNMPGAYIGSYASMPDPPVTWYSSSGSGTISGTFNMEIT